MARSSATGFPRYMRRDGDEGRFVVIGPKGRKRRFRREDQARAAARQLAEWLHQRQETQAQQAARPSIGALVERWLDEELRFQPWDVGTRKVREFMFRRIARQLGERLVAQTDGLFLKRWLDSFCRNADQWNKWRHVLILLWQYALLNQMTSCNEAAKLPYRSVSKKLAANRKVRQPLDLPGFRCIHAHAPPWLQLAMELSLLTCQARKEVLNMKHADFRHGHLFVIRDKVAADSEMGFIKIAVTPELEELRRRSLQLASRPERPPLKCEQALDWYERGVSRQEIARRLDLKPRARTDRRHRLDAGQLVTQLICYARARRARNRAVRLVSPYLLHRAPERRRRISAGGKPHWTCIEPAYLSRTFAAVRDATERWSSLKPEQRPTFHEIRGLGARLAEAQGVPADEIGKLMTHASTRTTAIYLEQGPGALSDADYEPVRTFISLRDLLDRSL